MHASVQTWQNSDLHSYDIVPWKLSGRPHPDGSFYAFEAKLRAHFKQQGPQWQLRIQKADFEPSRSVDVVIGANRYPMLLELVSRNEDNPERYDARRLHLIRMTSWPDYVQEAMDAPGRSVYNRGRWEPMQGRTQWD